MHTLCLVLWLFSPVVVNVGLSVLNACSLHVLDVFTRGNKDFIFVFIPLTCSPGFRLFFDKWVKTDAGEGTRQTTISSLVCRLGGVVHLIKARKHNNHGKFQGKTKAKHCKYTLHTVPCCFCKGHRFKCTVSHPLNVKSAVITQQFIK